MSGIVDGGGPPADQWAGQHRPRHQFWRWLLAVVIVVILLGAAGVGAALLQKKDSPLVAPTASAAPSISAGACPDAPVHVAAAPEIAPVIEAAARTLEESGAACGPVAVTAQEPAAVANAAKKPDVWIPSSTAWLEEAAANGHAYTTKGAPLARSPIVLAGPSPIASYFIQDGKTSWAAVTAGAASQKLPVVSMADPQQNTVGLLSVYAVHQAMSRTTTDAGIAQLQALTLRSRLTDATTGPAQKLATLAADSNSSDAAFDAGVFPVTEQELATYQQGKHLVSLTAAPPVDGLIDADYPFAIAHGAGHQSVIAKLRAAITKSAVTRAGFRTTATPGALPLPPKVDDLLVLARQWAQYRTLNFQTLLLIDTSGSMNEKIKDQTGHTTTKAALLRQSGAAAAALFGEGTSLGLWLFGTPTPSSPPHQEVVPLGPLSGTLDGKTRRDVLTAAMGGYKAAAKAGTPLYQTVLDGEAAMQKQVKPGTVTLVIVLTDGEDGQSRYSMSQQTFLTKLAAQRDPQRPVPIIAVGYGPTADMKSLTAMAQATGGQAIPATNPADLASAMAQAFLAAHSA
jgi:Ca-activated chloride channel family protein